MSTWGAIALIVFMVLQIVQNILIAWRLHRLEKVAREAGVIQ